MDYDKQKISDITLGGFIRLLRELALLGVVSYLCVKLFSGELSLDFAKLSPTELVNLLLAFFSISLSAAFYFAATTQSNQFYDNVNKFSKETSELLGRVDEQVKGIGGRQTELRDSLDKYKARDYFQIDQTHKAEEQAKAVKENLSKIVTGILDKTGLSVSEREKIQAELKAKDAQLLAIQERLSRDSANRDKAITRYAANKIRRFGTKKAEHMTFEEWALPVLQSGVGPYRRDLVAEGYITTLEITSPEQITAKGRSMLESALEIAMGLEKS